MSLNITHACWLRQLSWNNNEIHTPLGNPFNLSNLITLTYTFPNIRPSTVTIISFLSHTYMPPMNDPLVK